MTAMSKKKRQQQQEKPEEPLGENWTNPFKDLNIKFEEPDPPPPPPPKPTFEQEHPTLTKEGRALIAAFGAEDDDAPSLSRSDTTKKWPLLTLSHERKGRGGKTVTLVKGLERLTTLEQMELCDGIKTSLGIGGRFMDGTLELQGDQRERAAKWLEGNKFRTKIC